MLSAAARGLRAAAQGRSTVSALASIRRGLAADAAGGGSGGSAASGGTSPHSAPHSGDAEPAAAEQLALHEHIISVDRSGLINPQSHSHDPAVLAAQAAAAGVVKEEETPLARHLQAVIQVSSGWLPRWLDGVAVTGRLHGASMHAEEQRHAALPRHP